MATYRSNSPEPATGSRLPAAAFLLGFCLLGATPFLLLGTWLAVRSLYAQTWPSATGTLLAGHVSVSEDPEVTNRYKIDVAYEYHVAGQRHQGRRWSPTARRYGLRDRAEAERLLHRLREAPLRVYYNPLAPADAALSVRPSEFTFWIFSWGWGFFLLFAVTIGCGSVSTCFDERIAKGSPGDAPGPLLPRSWRRFGIRDLGDRIDVAICYKRWGTLACLVGLTMIGVGLLGGLTLFSPIPGGWWQWGALAVGTALAIRHHNEKRPAGFHRFDVSHGAVFLCRGAKLTPVAALREVRSVAFIQARQESGGSESHEKALLVLQGNAAGVPSDRRARPPSLLTLDFSDLPDEVAERLARRLAELIRVPLATRLHTRGSPPELGQPLNSVKSFADGLGWSLLIAGFGLVFAAAGISMGWPLRLPWVFGQLLFIAFGSLLALAGVSQALLRLKFGKPEAAVTPEVIRPGDRFTVRYRQRVRSRVTIRGGSVAFVLREVETSRHGSETETRNHDRLIRQFDLPRRHYTAGESLEEECDFQIPSDGAAGFRERGNPLLWVIKVQIDLPVRCQLYEEYEVAVAEPC